MRLRILLLALATLSGPVFAAAAQEAPKPQDPPPTVESVVKRLGAEDFQAREAASADLAKLPAEALQAVEALLKGTTLEQEVRLRLERALPQLRAKARGAEAKQKHARFSAWTRKTSVEAYSKVGRKDPKWDEQAGKGLELVTRLWGGEGSADENTARQANEALEQAIGAGCDDPLVLYAHARVYVQCNPGNREAVIQKHVAAARKLKEVGSGYHPMRQTYIFARGADCLAVSKPKRAAPERKECEAFLNLGFDKFGEAAKDAEQPDFPLQDCGAILITASLGLTKDRKPGFDRVYAILAQARPKSAFPLVLKGEVYTKYAWDARGNGWANSVTEQGWKLMKERLAVAEEALTRAWELDPGDPAAATQMIDVELGQSKGREVMELWFKRAMTADPNNEAACRSKMYYLEPKWHGSAEDMLAFGRELLAGANWDARLPFKLIDAHLTLAGYSADQAAYFRNKEVWKDVQAVYEPYLKGHAEAWHDRSFYAKLACWAGEYGEAKRQFEALGTHAAVSAFKNGQEMEQLKREAAVKGK